MAANNAINNQAFSIMGVPFIGVNFVTLYGSLTTSPSGTIYTVPTGKKAILYQYMYRNTSGVSQRLNTRYTIGGSSYDTAQLINLSNNASRGERPTKADGGNIYIWNPGIMVMNAGESFEIIGVTASSVQYFLTMMEFADNVPFKSVRNLNLNSSPVTLYTVPAGKKALFGVQTVETGGFLWTTGAGGASRTRTVNLVNSGDVVATTNELSRWTGGGNTYNIYNLGQSENQNYGFCLTAGDSVVLTQTVTSGTNWVSLNVYEMDL